VISSYPWLLFFSGAGDEAAEGTIKGFLKVEARSSPTRPLKTLGRFQEWMISIEIRGTRISMQGRAGCTMFRQSLDVATRCCSIESTDLAVRCAPTS